MKRTEYIQKTVQWTWFAPVLTLLFAVSAHAGPAIMSPAPVFDFGEMDSDQKVANEFLIKNVGDEPLVISDVKTSCGCTVAKLEKNTLNPGEETKISASLNLKGKQGPQSKKITVMSNDGQQPNYYLEFTGVATPTIMIVPKLLTFGQIKDNELHTQSLTIKSMKADHAFSIEQIVVPENSPFTADYEVIEAGKEYRITATTISNLADGTINGRFSVMTDDPEHKILNVGVFGNVIGELHVRPDAINIRANTAADAPLATQFLQILPGRTANFELLDVIAPIPGMKAELIKRKDNDYHVKVSEMPVDMTLDGKELIVTTNLPQKPEIRIPFRVTPAAPVRVGKTPARTPVARPTAQPRPPAFPAPVSSN